MAKIDANKIAITFNQIPLNEAYTPFVFNFESQEWQDDYMDLSEANRIKIARSMGVSAHLLGIYPEVIEDER